MHPTRFEVVQGDVPMLEPKYEEDEDEVVVDEAKCEKSGFVVTILKNYRLTNHGSSSTREIISEALS